MRDQLFRNTEPPVYDQKRRMVAVWMRTERAGPVDGIRVFVTPDALWQLEPGCKHDVATALAIFERQIHKIEVKASNRFIAHGPEEGEFYRGRPITVLTTSDFW